MRIENVESRVQEMLTLDQFLRVVEDRFDPYDLESTWSVRDALAGLALNQEWIFATIAERLRERIHSPWAREQPSYFVLHVGKNFGLRANIWLPERSGANSTVLENAAFSYDYPHDHNFDILTATCFGPGYETEVYEYEAMPTDASVNDLITVESLGRKLLSPGLIFLYEACKDVHTQLPVKDVTVTLNFLPFRKEDHERPQMIFEHVDATTMRIVGAPLSPEGREMSAVRMLAKLASGNFGDGSGLHLIATGAANPRVAEYSASKLANLRCGPSASHEVLLEEIDRQNVAFKYHEVATVSRSKTV